MSVHETDGADLGRVPAPRKASDLDDVPAAASDPTPQELMRRIAADDRAAMRTLYGRYENALFDYFERVFDGDEVAADEHVCDVFVEVWRLRAAYDARRAAPWTWILRKIVPAILKEERRSELRRRLRESRAAAEQGSFARDFVEDAGGDPDGTPVLVAASPAPSAEEALPAKQRLDAIHAQLPKVPAAQREALALAHFGEMTPGEIAARLNVPEETVRTRLKRGLALLKTRVGARRTEEEGDE